MSARVLMAVLLLAPAVASARGPFHTVGWSRDLCPAGADLPRQVPKPMEKWDTPVDKTPNWTNAPDWEERERQAKSWDRTHLPL